MRLDFFDRRSAERFAELLDESDGNRGEQGRGQADEQLAELVAIAHSLSAAPPRVQADPGFRTDLRAMLVAAAERDGIGATARLSDEEAEAGAPVRRGFALTGRRIRARGAIVIGVAASAMAVSGISAASENAIPGDALYGVKRSTERAQLAMAGSEITRGQLSLTFARNRLAEAAAMDFSDPKFGDALDDMDADTKQGVKLLHSAAVSQRETTALDSVDSFVDSQRGVLNPAVERLSPPNAERAAESLNLLDAVGQRAGNLRERLTCEPAPATAGSDALGPKLEPCGKPARSNSGTGTGSSERNESRDRGDKSPATSSPTKNSTPDDDKSGGDKKQDAVDKEPTAEPGDSRRTTGPADSDATDEPTADVTDTTDTSETAEPTVSDDPANPPTEANKGLLGGLLGNLFGSD